MGLKPKQLCPFSLSFAVGQKSQIQGPGSMQTAKIKVGLPCAAEGCMWWSKTINDCVIFEILGYLEIINKGKENA